MKITEKEEHQGKCVENRTENKLKLTQIQPIDVEQTMNIAVSNMEIRLKWIEISKNFFHLMR